MLPVPCDCKVLAELRFYHLGICIIMLSDYNTATLNIIQHFIQNAELLLTKCTTLCHDWHTYGDPELATLIVPKLVQVTTTQKPSYNCHIIMSHLLLELTCLTSR